MNIVPILIVAWVAASCGAITVTTPYGAVLGTVYDGVSAFRGIPYAAPPVGALRFAKPQPAQPWKGVLNGTAYAPGCPAQCPLTSFPVPTLMCAARTSEDCLYINVYTPNVSPAKLLPVILFIHGGNYVYGSGGVPMYDGTSLAKTQNVVVVTINYRIGVLGALYTGTVRGNFQTQDQREAMNFTQRVIKSFGGDPRRVTISGQSAGAFSVATHLTTPLSWPLFSGAIFLSDPLALPAASPAMAMELGMKVLTQLGCPAGGEVELQCLRNKSVSDFVTANSVDYDVEALKLLRLFMQWVPVVDGDELPYAPIEALSTGQFHKVPILFGTVANESVQFVYDAVDKPLSELEYYIMIDLLVGAGRAAEVDKLYGRAPEPDRADMRLFAARPMTDYLFYCATRYVGAALTKIVPTYVHYFDYAASFSAWAFNSTMPYCVTNVCHAQDLAFYFNPFGGQLPPSLHPPTPTAAEERLVQYMQTMWGNFAQSGSPNPLPVANFTKFGGLAVNNVMNLSVPVAPLSSYRNSFCDFWDTVGYNFGEVALRAGAYRAGRNRAG